LSEADRKPLASASPCDWAAWGDLNAFFGLFFDNVTNLVILSGILIGGFGYPAQSVYCLMIPGTALGVLVGDLLYSFLAIRLAKRTGRSDVTAMPLGLDTPSTIGIALCVLGPVWLESRDATLTWQAGMATLMLIGVAKLLLSFFGDWIRRSMPRAGLLGSLAGVGIALLAFFPLMKMFSAPAAGLVSMGVIVYSLVAGRRLPFGAPGAFVAVLAGSAIYYAMNLGDPAFKAPALELHPALPLPTLAFLHGIPLALSYLPLALPFAILTIVGGINVTESARAAGDEYKTRDILLVEAVSTMVAALFGGVSQTTPYIGHPAYKAIGARSAYTLATGLFIGIGGALGLMGFIVQAVPDAAVAPVLLFVAAAIVSQAFLESPKRHAPAVAFAAMPVIGYLVMAFMDTVVGKLPPGSVLPPSLLAEHETLRVLGHGFILTAILWGAAVAALIDGETRKAAFHFALCGALSLFGVIHSALASGGVYLPWTPGNPAVWHVAGGYAAVAALLLLLSFRKKDESIADGAGS